MKEKEVHAASELLKTANESLIRHIPQSIRVVFK